MRLVALTVMTALLCFAQVNTLAMQQQEAANLTFWKSSAAAVAGASAFDIASSWGRCCEANRLLASPDGRFRLRGMTIKSSTLGAQLLAQYFLARRNPKLGKILAYVNFASAGALTGSAVRNLRIPQR